MYKSQLLSRVLLNNLVSNNLSILIHTGAEVPEFLIILLTYHLIEDRVLASSNMVYNCTIIKFIDFCGH